MTEFAYVVRPALDAAFMAAATEEERAVVDRHWEFLLGLHREGRLTYAGRCYDGPFGIVVFQAEDEDEAAELMAKDPTVAARVQEAELHPFKTGLVRGEPVGEG